MNILAVEKDQDTRQIWSIEMRTWSGPKAMPSFTFLYLLDAPWGDVPVIVMFHLKLLPTAMQTRGADLDL